MDIEERIEKLEKNIECTDSLIKWIVACLLILGAVEAWGASVIYFKIKELADFTLWADKILRAIIDY